MQFVNSQVNRITRLFTFQVVLNLVLIRMGNSQFTEVAVIAQMARRERIQNGPRPPCGLPRDGPLNRDLRRLVQSFLRADPTKVVKPERCPTGDVDEEHPIGSMMLRKCLMHN